MAKAVYLMRVRHRKMFYIVSEVREGNTELDTKLQRVLFPFTLVAIQHLITHISHTLEKQLFN